VNPYLERRNGRQPVTYPHPSLEPILRRTLGVPLFQEQVLRIAMTAAKLSGGEAEELRRAMGFKRSAARMQKIEQRLREGMARNGITGSAAEEIIRSISSFALYGFPESHAASFALIAYASAYLKCHHPAAFSAAMLNCYPLGFYHPATLVKDAQRHGVIVLPIDVTRSDWLCTIEHLATPVEPSPASHDAREKNANVAPDALSRNQAGEGQFIVPSPFFSIPSPPLGESVSSDHETLALRLGLKYLRGLREEAGRAIGRERAMRPFKSIADLTSRVALSRRELDSLADAGAFSAFGLGRREALWQAAAVERDPSSLLAGAEPSPGRAPLREMTPSEETRADYATTGVTTGPHLMAHIRPRLKARGVLSAAELSEAQNGATVQVAGVVIVRQRPGTAKGFFFLTLEDETGVANAIVTPDLFHRHRATLHRASLLLVEGVLQKVDGVVSIRSRRFAELRVGAELPKSHDFH